MNREYQIQNNCDVYCPVCSFPLGPQTRPTADMDVPEQLWLARRLDGENYVDDDSVQEETVADLRDATVRQDFLFSCTRASPADALCPVNENLQSDDPYILVHKCCYDAMDAHFGRIEIFSSIVEDLTPSPLIGAMQDTFQWASQGVAAALANYDAWVIARVTRHHKRDTLAHVVRAFVRCGVLLAGKYGHYCDICRRSMTNDFGDVRCAMFNCRVADVCMACVQQYTDRAVGRATAWYAVAHCQSQ